MKLTSNLSNSYRMDMKSIYGTIIKIRNSINEFYL